MQADLLTVPAGMRYLELQRLLVTAQVSGVPVVDSGGAVIGIVSATDLLRAAEEAFDEDLDAGEPDDRRDRFAALTAGELATPEVIWVSPETPIAQVAQRMRSD